jgi:hypothetical protein
MIKPRYLYSGLLAAAMVLGSASAMFAFTLNTDNQPKRPSPTTAFQPCDPVNDYDGCLGS